MIFHGFQFRYTFKFKDLPQLRILKDIFTTSEGNFKIYIGRVSRYVSDSDIISMYFTTSSVQKTPTQFSQPKSNTASSVRYS